MQEPDDGYLPTLRGFEDGKTGVGLAGLSPYSLRTDAEADKTIGESVETVQTAGKGKRKAEDVDGKVKKTRQSQSCDACRARKPPPGSTVDPAMPTKDVCSHCAHLDLACTFQYRPKKRGPPNQYLRKIQESNNFNATADPNVDPSSVDDQFAKPTWPSSDLLRGGHTPPVHGSTRQDLPPRSEDIVSAVSQVQAHWDPRMSPSIRDGSMAIRLPPLSQHDQRSTPPSRHIEAYPRSGYPPKSRTDSPAFARSFDHFSGSSHPLSRTSPSMALSPTTSRSPIASHAHNPNNPLDRIMPRGILYFIIDLYFDYIYGLCPFVHRPSFMRDLYARKEEQPGNQEWVALVMGIVGSTLVQIPRSFVPLPRDEVKALLSTARDIVATYLATPYREVTTTRYVLLYTSSLELFAVGFLPGATEFIGRCCALLSFERLNEEEAYASFNPVEREIRRRLLWLIAGGDKSGCVSKGQPPLLADFQYASVGLPSLIEDEYFSEEGYQHQPEGKTSILTGFFYVSKLYRRQMLDKQAADRVTSPTGIMLQMRIVEINALYSEVMALMIDCPPELSLDDRDDAASAGSMPEDWGALASREIEELFSDPKASKKAVKDGFLVQQANIYVTQQMVRYILLQYRDDLLSLQQEELAAQSRGGPAGSEGYAGQRRMGKSRAMFSETEKAQVAADLLVILQKIPISVIAVNNLSLIPKVRFVASTLLDALNEQSRPPSPSSQAHDASSATRVDKAQSYLWEFLRILSEIEALSSLEQDESPMF